MQRVTMPSTGLASAAAGQRSERPVENCRDYLRTGRCKYGPSCKYYHPPGVGTGGGMKTPPNPTEPLFPIRPNEPLCQYYMKHGTCKFGQACKFHHPPQTGFGGGATANRRTDPPPMILSPVQVGTEGSSLLVQYLPQRPDEPDCIYFLKNGRCKYGATCRYHHPINGNFRPGRQDQRDIRSGRPTMEQPLGNKIQILNPGGQITQGIVIDPSHTMPPVSTFIPNYSDYRQDTVATENPSSVSSMGSSHEASGTSLDYNIPLSDWQRPNRSGSGNSLNAYAPDPSLIVRNQSSPSLSDGSIARRPVRAPSPGSSSDGVYEVSSTPDSWARQQTRSSSFDLPPSRRPLEPGSPHMRGRYPPAHRVPPGPRMGPQRRPGDRDGGYDMMVTGLLGMLETTEETSAEVHSEDGAFHYPIDDDDASRLFGGLSLESQAATAVASNPNNVQYEDSRWSPSWQRSDMSPHGQDMIHPYIQSQSSTHGNPIQFHQHHGSQNSENPSDFGQYLP